MATKNVTFNLGIQASGLSFNYSEIFSNEDLSHKVVTIPGSTSDKEVAISFALADLSLIYIDTDYDLSLETNDGTTPQETISVLAVRPVFWCDVPFFAVPFAGAITGFFFTNAGSDDATVNIITLKDTTP